MYKKLTKKAKILNLLTRGSKVTWTQLKTTYGLKSPRAMIDTIRRDGFVVYANKTLKVIPFIKSVNLLLLFLPLVLQRLTKSLKYLMIQSLQLVLQKF